LAHFTQEFLAELEDKSPMSAAISGYYEQLKRLIEYAAPDITAWLQPETKEVDLEPVRRMWEGLQLDPLPEDFGWSLVASNYARDIRSLIKKDPELRAQLASVQRDQMIAAQEQANQSLRRIAPPDHGFDLNGYREFLRAKCGQLQLAVMHKTAYDRQIELWSVFVPQSARESVPVPEIPRDVLRQLRQEGQIADKSSSLTDDEALSRVREQYNSSPVRPVMEVLKSETRVVVLGDPGSGKTSLVKYRVHEWVERGSPGPDSEPLPLWVELKEYARVHLRANNDLFTYLGSAESGYPLDANRVHECLQSARAAIYLDGLDEIFDPGLRQSVIDQIAGLAARHSSARIVVTSRIIGYEAERLSGAGFAHATLEDFDDQQVLAFLEHWHAVAERDHSERKRLQSQMARALKDSRAIRALAGNPLLLTMMAILNRNQELPRDRVELYKEAGRVLLHDWDAHRALAGDTFGRQEKEALLRELAGGMQRAPGGLAGNLIERKLLLEIIQRFLASLGIEGAFDKSRSLVRQLTERNFILCPAGADRFSFVHRTFLEYYCADWFYEQLKQSLDLEQLKELFRKHWKDEKWHEVLRLIAGMVTEKQAEALILLLMEEDGRAAKLANLMLAAGCLSEIRNRKAVQKTDEMLRQQFVQKAVRYQPPYYYEPWEKFSEAGGVRRQAVALFAFVWRSKNTRAWLQSTVEHDADWILRMAAVEELARGWKDDAETLPIVKERARSDERPDVRRAAVQKLAQTWKDDAETLPILKERARSDADPSVRNAAVHELARGWKEDTETLPWVKECARSNKHFDVRTAAVQELARGWKENAETLSILKQRARSDEHFVVRMAAVQELARGWKKDGETLPWVKECARSDEHSVVRMAAVEELARGWKENAETLPWLKERARSDGDPEVRSAAVRELARGWRDDCETLPIVKECARANKHSIVRMAAMQELVRAWKDDAETLAILKERACSDEDKSFRSRAVRELARGWRDDAETPTIVKERAHSDWDHEVRRAAMKELVRGWNDQPETLSVVKERARSDEHGTVRMLAVRELVRGWKDDAETLVIVKERARSDETFAVRMAAVQELTRGWKDDAETLAIVKECARSDKDARLRMIAVRELARGWKDDAETLAILKESARSDADPDVRRAAVQELARGSKNDGEALAILKERACSDENPEVRRAAMRELARGWKEPPVV
jgi:GTPase SAR1 family protein